MKKALKIKDKSYSYINEERAWNETIYDLLSFACYQNKKYQESYKFIKKAIKINPNDQRLNENYKIIKEYYKQVKNRKDFN